MRTSRRSADWLTLLFLSLGGEGEQSYYDLVSASIDFKTKYSLA